MQRAERRRRSAGQQGGRTAARPSQKPDPWSPSSQPQPSCRSRTWSPSIRPATAPVPAITTYPSSAEVAEEKATLDRRRPGPGRRPRRPGRRVRKPGRPAPWCRRPARPRRRPPFRRILAERAVERFADQPRPRPSSPTRLGLPTPPVAMASTRPSRLATATRVVTCRRCRPRPTGRVTNVRPTGSDTARRRPCCKFVQICPRYCKIGLFVFEYPPTRRWVERGEPVRLEGCRRSTFSSRSDRSAIPGSPRKRASVWWPSIILARRWFARTTPLTTE